ncbi:hypothetical protein O4H52_11865 [Sphingomonadaceae bacterium G21617-S1]|jgi:hypothetical protein|nr:hypothetical protein [Sphingomonadaceae bacterium G21617-S1]TAK05900.1 MAG: hypothetical protein EPO38_14915 [Rhizorhabdus sp.]
MMGKALRLETIYRRLALAFIALALLMRLLVPAGFMPARGQGFAITLCTGMGAMPAWVDKHGQIHKGKQAPDKQVEHPCAFGAFGAALDLPGGAAGLPLPFVAGRTLLTALGEAVSIGHGLAAPPPPSTGPPLVP